MSKGRQDAAGTFPASAYRVVDAHVHVIEHIAGMGRRGESRAVGDGKVRWVTGEVDTIIPAGWGTTSFTHDALVKVLDEHGVSQAVMVQGSYYGFCNDYTFEAQQRHAGRLFGMGTFDPFVFMARPIMDRLAGAFQFRGFKFEVSRSYGLMGFLPELRLDGEIMRPVWRYASEHGLVISLDLGTFGEPSFQVEALARIAAEYSSVRFVIEHLFAPGPGRFDEVRTALGPFARLQNVFVTLASVPSSRHEAYPFPSACRYALIARDAFGAGRILWGSDLPSVAVSTPYRQLIDYLAESGQFQDAELRGIYGENAIRVYGLDDKQPR